RSLAHRDLPSFPTRRSSDLRRSVREQDTVARLGGDEFGILLPDVDAARAQAAAARLLEELDTEAQLSLIGGGHGVSASVGVAMRSEEHTSELQSRSDLVCRL